MPAPKKSKQVLLNLRDQPVEVHLLEEVVLIGPGESVKVAAGTTGQLEELVRRGVLAVEGGEAGEAGPPAGDQDDETAEEEAGEPAGGPAATPAQSTSKKATGRRRGSASTTRGGK